MDCAISYILDPRSEDSESMSPNWFIVFPGEYFLDLYLVKYSDIVSTTIIIYLWFLVTCLSGPRFLLIMFLISIFNK